MKKIGLLILLLCFCFSCSYSVQEGRRIDKAKVDQIAPGKTDSKTLVSTLGKPEQVIKGKGGEEKYIYEYYQSVPTHWYNLDKEDWQKLEVTLKNGVVERYQIRGADLTKVKE